MGSSLVLQETQSQNKKAFCTGSIIITVHTQSENPCTCAGLPKVKTCPSNVPEGGSSVVSQSAPRANTLSGAELSYHHVDHSNWLLVKLLAGRYCEDKGFMTASDQRYFDYQTCASYDQCLAHSAAYPVMALRTHESKLRQYKRFQSSTIMTISIMVSV